MLIVLFTVKKKLSWLIIVLEKKSTTLGEKDALGKLCEKYKLEYDEKLNSTSGQVIYNKNKKKHTNQTPREVNVAKVVREFYSNLKDVKHDDSNLKGVICITKRCYERCSYASKSKEIGEINVEPSKSKYRKAGGERKATIPDVRDALFDCFIDICETLKSCLPSEMFKTQYKIFYEQWLAQQSKKVPKVKKIVFSNRWVQNWMSEDGFSLRHPHRWFQTCSRLFKEHLDSMNVLLRQLWVRSINHKWRPNAFISK